MYNSRYDQKLSIGDNIHILGEKNYDADEEEKKEIEELQMVQELTQSINEIQSDIAGRVEA